MSNIKIKQLHQSGATNGQVPTWNGSVWAPADPGGLAAMLANGIDGFLPEWTSTTVIRVNPHSIYGKSGYFVLGGTVYTCTSPYNIDITTDLDTKSLTGTIAVTNASASVAGSSTLFLTEFGTRALSVGTCAATASITIIGTSTRFLDEVRIDDLIGNSTDGYVRVTAIATDTSLTVASPFTITVGSCRVIENPVIKCTDTAEVRRVNTITSNTALTVTSAFTATDASSGATIGEELASTWFHVWVGSTTGKLSTQRTTKYNSTSHRRRCGIYNNSSGDLANTTYKTDGGNQIAGRMRSATLQYAINNVTTHATNWAIADYSAYVPPTAVEISEIVVFCGDSTDALAFKELPASGSYDALESYAPTSLAAGSRVVKVQVGCRGQAVAYASYSGSTSASNYVTGTPGRWVEYA